MLDIYESAMPDTDSKPTGTQSIGRAAAVLRALALRSQSGARMADIARETGLERPTAHRILQGLIAEGMASQNEDTRRYHLGPFIYELGLLAEPRFHLRELARPAIDLLADQTGDTVFAAVRGGNDALCVERKAGSFPIKAFTVDVGSRIPLGIGCGGIAMLAALPEEEAESILAYNAPRLAAYGDLTASQLAELVAAARSRGYAVNPHRAPGIAAIGMAVRRADGSLAGSISIAAIESRLPPERSEKIARLLRTEIRKIEKMLRAS
jgi:DNA-binding IclR family transcriptional regulator